MARPRYPLYIASKGRADSRLTVRMLDRLGVDYWVVVEEPEYGQYAQVIDAARLLILDPEYQRSYETCDDLGDLKSKGPGPARNFAWQHALDAGYRRHWVLDDNIRAVHRLVRNIKVRMADGTGFAVMEDFVDRYTNVALAGPRYESLQPRKQAVPPLVLNSRVYSCILIDHAIPYRWRGRYNEDTDLSIRALKAGWCTVQFNAFLQDKAPTQTLRGGNTDEFYRREGTRPKSEMIEALHPDVCQVVWKYNRIHHQCDYRPFRGNKLAKRPGLDITPGVNEYGMQLVRIEGH